MSPQWWKCGLMKNTDVIDRPVRSLDLNVIENLRSFLARAVYAIGKQYGSVSSFRSDHHPEVGKNWGIYLIALAEFNAQ